MKKSISKKFFLVCFVCVLGCVIVFSGVIIAFSTKYFQDDKYNMMQRNAAIAANVTSNYVVQNNPNVDEGTIFAIYEVLSTTVGADFLMVDNSGVILYQTGGSKIPSDYIFSKDIISAVQENNLQITKRVEGVSEQASYVVGVPVMVGKEAVSSVIVVAPADDMFGFLRESGKTMLITSVIVLFLSSMIIYFMTSRMLNPLRQMVEATHSFAEGDFSKRIPVYQQNEVGQLAMAFNKMAATLAVTEGTRRAFIANVSHELKTPMTTIGGFVDGILDGTIPQEQESRYLEIVSSEVKRLTRLVHSMLDTARIDAGEMDLDLSKFDISELVRQSIFNFEQKVDEKNITISGLEVDRQMAYADRDLIHQVIYNLVENAVKFVNVGGEISVRYKVKDGKLHTTIRNTGEGLTKEDIHQIFGQFYKSDRSRTDFTSGVGLGLHIVKSIINYHNGDITVDSVLDEYTEFTFVIDSTDNIKKSSKSQEN